MIDVVWRQQGGKYTDTGAHVLLSDALRSSPFAKVRCLQSGRVMELQANQPGMQLYTGNFMDGAPGRGGPHTQYSAFCPETQAPPNAINVEHWRSAALVEPSQEYRHIMVHRFSAS